jgi:hypothetical protein
VLILNNVFTIIIIIIIIVVMVIIAITIFAYKAYACCSVSIPLLWNTSFRYFRGLLTFLLPWVSYSTNSPEFILLLCLLHVLNIIIGIYLLC